MHPVRMYPDGGDVGMTEPPQPHKQTRDTFITLYNTRLFTADQVWDMCHRSQCVEREKMHVEQCDNCVRNGLRECMYHGYPEDTIPESCAYKIGNAALRTVYEVPTIIRKHPDSQELEGKIIELQQQVNHDHS